MFLHISAILPALHKHCNGGNLWVIVNVNNVVTKVFACSMCYNYLRRLMSIYLTELVER